MSGPMSASLSIESGAISDGKIPIRINRNPQATPKALLVFAHGGGFSWGSLDDYDQICRNLAEGVACTVVSVDYRLAPQHRFPAGFDDVYHATLWAAANLSTFKTDKLIICGDSAGACLAAGVAQRAASESSVHLDGQLLIYPMLEYYDHTPPGFFTLSDRFHPSFDAIRGAWDVYLGGPKTELPAFAVPPRTTDLSALPPAFVALAGNDPLKFEGLSYAEAMRSAGNRVEHRHYSGAGHGFLSELPSAQGVRAALGDMVAWIDQLVSEQTLR